MGLHQHDAHATLCRAFRQCMALSATSEMTLTHITTHEWEATKPPIGSPHMNIISKAMRSPAVHGMENTVSTNVLPQPLAVWGNTH